MNNHNPNNLRTFKKININDINEIRKNRDLEKNLGPRKKNNFKNPSSANKFNYTTNVFYTPNAEVIY